MQKSLASFEFEFEFEFEFDVNKAYKFDILIF